MLNPDWNYLQGSDELWLWFSMRRANRSQLIWIALYGSLGEPTRPSLVPKVSSIHAAQILSTTSCQLAEAKLLYVIYKALPEKRTPKNRSRKMCS